jgi:hypothetical protein
MQKHEGFKPVGTSLPIALLLRIDRERGDVPRSRFILRLLEIAYSIHEEQNGRREGGGAS